MYYAVVGVIIVCMSCNIESVLHCSVELLYLIILFVYWLLLEAGCYGIYLEQVFPEELRLNAAAWLIIMWLIVCRTLALNVGIIWYLWYFWCKKDTCPVIGRHGQDIMCPINLMLY